MADGKVNIVLTGQLGNWLFLTASAVKELGRDRLHMAYSHGTAGQKYARSAELFSRLCDWLPVRPAHIVQQCMGGYPVNTRQRLSNWQSLEFMPPREICRELFKVPAHDVVDDPVIHVRGSDYLTFFGDADVKATGDRVLMCAEGLGAGIGECVIVTDDPYYVRSLGLSPRRIVSGSVVEDFALMASACRLAISPSTFSWWAGFLGRHDDVVFPQGFGPWDAGVLDADEFSAHSNAELCWGEECHMVGDPMHYADTAYVLICTGRYKDLFDGFYKSFAEHVKGDVKLYVFTDDIPYFSRYAGVRCFHTPHGRWPSVVLGRYGTLLAYRRILSRHKAVVMLQANMRFVADVDHSGLAGTMLCYHPYNGDKRDYVCGGLVGGDTESFFRLAEWVDSYIKGEVSAGRTPEWHDETAVNEYWHRELKGQVRFEPSCTMYAEERQDLKTEGSKILLLDKDRFFGCGKAVYAG